MAWRYRKQQEQTNNHSGSRFGDSGNELEHFNHLRRSGVFTWFKRGQFHLYPVSETRPGWICMQNVGDAERTLFTRVSRWHLYKLVMGALSICCSNRKLLVFVNGFNGFNRNFHQDMAMHQNLWNTIFLYFGGWSSISPSPLKVNPKWLYLCIGECCMSAFCSYMPPCPSQAPPSPQVPPKSPKIRP